MRFIIIGNLFVLKVLFLTSNDVLCRNTFNTIFHENFGKISWIYHFRDRFTDFPDQYDFGISFLYTYKIPKKEINKATWINFHPGPLPEYGGRNIIYHAIMNGETQFGVTVHEMTENFDDGPIIYKEMFDIYGLTAGEVNMLTRLTASRMAINHAVNIISNHYYTEPNNGLQYFHKEKIDDHIKLLPSQKKEILAKYCPPHYPKITVGDKKFIIKEAE